jgi:hypothetical protein
MEKNRQKHQDCVNQGVGLKDPSMPKLSRRGLLGALAATGLVGCKTAAHVSSLGPKDHDGYGKPYPEPGGNALAARANLALWLLLTTNRDFLTVSMPTQANYTTTVTHNLNDATLAANLKYLGTPGDYIKSVLTRAGSLSYTGKVKGIADGKVIDASINYGVALKVVQQLFYEIAHMSYGSNSPYGPGNCPSMETVLSLVADQPYP